MPDIHGQEPPYEVDRITGSMDSSGVVTSTIKYMVKTEHDCVTYKRGELHPTLGIPESERSWEEEAPCGFGFLLTIVYKSIGTIDGEEDIELDSSYSEEPIESHPNLLKIMEKYQGFTNSEGEIEFPKTYEPEKGGFGLDKREGEEEEKKNPMFGVKTWLALASVVRRTWISSRRPSLSRMGRIVKSVPGGFQTPEGHDWIIMPPKSRRRGDGYYENTEEYLLSPLGGWTEGVYELMEGHWSPETDEDGFGLTERSIEESSNHFGIEYGRLSEDPTTMIA